MTLKTKRNLYGILAVAGFLSIVGRGVQLACGGDIDGWHVKFQVLVSAVFGDLWYKFRRLYNEEQFYRRYRDNFDA